MNEQMTSYETIEQNTMGYQDEYGTKWKIEKDTSSNVYSVYQLTDSAYIFQGKTKARSYLHACIKVINN